MAILALQGRECKDKLMLSSDLFPARGDCDPFFLSIRHKKSAFLRKRLVLKSTFLSAGRRKTVLATTSLLSILSWIQMWCLEVHGLLVTRRWWLMRTREGNKQPPSHWVVDHVPAATDLQTWERKINSYLFKSYRLGNLLLAIKTTLNWHTHPRQPSLSNPTWEAVQTVVTNLDSGATLIFESRVYPD